MDEMHAADITVWFLGRSLLTYSVVYNAQHAQLRFYHSQEFSKHGA